MELGEALGRLPWRFPVRPCKFRMPLGPFPDETGSHEHKEHPAAFGDRQQLDRPADAATAAEIIAWARKRDLAVRWTTAPEMDSMTASLRLGVQEHKLLTLQTNGLVWVLVTQLSARLPILDEAVKTELIEDLRTRLLELPRAGQSSSGKGAKIAFRLEDLRAADSVGKLLRRSNG